MAKTWQKPEYGRSCPRPQPLSRLAEYSEWARGDGRPHPLRLLATAAPIMAKS